MAETETTEQIWDIVTGASSPSNSTLPKVSVSYSAIYMSFTETINNKTGLHFSFPTKDQWQYAAKGGNKSQGYTYAGSNTPGDVAWYSANTSSRQPVKTKAPNELGLYDLSGNVGEWTMAEENDIYVCGGDYRCGQGLITIGSSMSLSNFRYDYVGFRLILADL